MAMSSTTQLGYHAYTNLAALKLARTGFTTEQEFTYTFQNFFHPFVDDLVRQLNIDSLPGMLDPVFLEGWRRLCRLCRRPTPCSRGSRTSTAKRQNQRESE